jgi:hypothetical protein
MTAPSQKQDGMGSLHYPDNTARFRVWAPFASGVNVVLFDPGPGTTSTGSSQRPTLSNSRIAFLIYGILTSTPSSCFLSRTFRPTLQAEPGRLWTLRHVCVGKPIRDQPRPGGGATHRTHRCGPQHRPSRHSGCHIQPRRPERQSLLAV